MKSFPFSVFSENNCAGNLVELYFCEQSLTTEQMLSIARVNNFPASCFLNREQVEKSKVIDVRIFNQQNEIHFCGHGLLASAYYLMCYRNTTELMLNSNSELIDVRNKNGLPWIKLHSLDYQAAEVPAWTQHCFSQPPYCANVVGGSSGYWIFEWRKSFQLNQLVIDFDLLKQSTSRAVIATQSGNGETYDFNYRYFAPQYGIEEDQATGSANVILTNYWYRQLLQSRWLTSRQLSQSGAILYSQIEGNSVWLGGKVNAQR